MTIEYKDSKRVIGLQEDRIGATASQGNNGGSGLGGDQTNTGGGGGGGAGAAGANAANSAAGNGGNGLQSDITGTNTYYAGGGGGGTWANISGDPPGGTGGLGGGGNGGEHYDNPGTQTAGTANTGGGGGAAGITDGTTKAGGSGVVILQFTTSGTSYSTTGSPTVDTSSVSGKTVLKYTGSGTFVLSSGSPDVRYLVVGGGGGGAGGAGGGGGAGGFLTGTKSSLAIGTYTVTVGAGGAGYSSSTGTQLGSNGENSSFAGVVASGGGGGANNNISAPAGADGGSGGGGGGRHGGAGGSTVDGTTVSVTIPTDVQDNSLFVEKDTARRYWFDNIFSKTGLKAYYNFNESSGNLINQSTTGDGLGSNADGTASGDPTYSVTGKVDNAISFDGDGDKFTLGTAAGQWNFLHNNSDFSISFWLKLNATPSEQQGIMGTGTGGSSIGFDLKAQLNNNGRLVASIENGAGATASITSSDNFIPQNTTTWYHYVLTFSNGSWNIYRNGGNNESASSSISWSTSNHSRNMEIANANANTPTDVKDLTGELDEVSIWNRVLTSDEISALYNSGSGVAVTDAKNPTWLREKSYISKLGCLIYYNFDQTSGNATNLATTANGFTDGLGSTGDGVNSGATTGQTGKIDYAWSFDGTNDQVDSGSSSDLILTGDMTWAAWVNINTTTSSKVITVASIRGDAGSNTEANNALFSFFIVQNSSPPTLRAFHENAGGTNNQVDFTTSLHEDRWYHIVFTRDVSEKTVKCYIDGSLHGSGTYSNNPTTTTSTLPLRTGGNNFSGAAASDGHFNGLLDEVSIWNRILTADEISALYNSGHGVVI